MRVWNVDHRDLLNVIDTAQQFELNEWTVEIQ